MTSMNRFQFLKCYKIKLENIDLQEPWCRYGVYSSQGSNNLSSTIRLLGMFFAQHLNLKIPFG